MYRRYAHCLIADRPRGPEAADERACRPLTACSARRREVRNVAESLELVPHSERGGPRRDQLHAIDLAIDRQAQEVEKAASSRLFCIEKPK